MNIFNHPLFTNDFQRELAMAANTDSEVRAKANPAFVWVVEHLASPLLFKTMGQCLHFKFTPSWQKGPAMGISASPGGPDQGAVIVCSLDSKGVLRTCGSNVVPKPVRTEDPCPVKFFETFDALRSKAGQVELLHKVVSSVASKEHMDWVERVYKEGQRYRTSPVFLIVLDGPGGDIDVVRAPVGELAARVFVPPAELVVAALLAVRNLGRLAEPEVPVEFLWRLSHGERPARG